MRSGPRPAVAALGAADAGIPVNLDHFPAATLGDLGELIFCRSWQAAAR